MQEVYSWKAKLRMTVNHVIPCLDNLNPRGLFAERLHDSLRTHRDAAEQQAIADALGPERDGFLALEDSLGRDHPRHQTFLADPTQFYRLLDEVDAALPATGNLRPEKPQFLSSLARAIEAAGAVPVFLIPPRLAADLDLIATYEAGYIPHLIAFNDPSAYPELHAIERRFDIAHLDTEGAWLYTRHIADRFRRLVLTEGDRTQ